MLFHENCLLANNSLEISYLIFSKFGKMSQNVFAAVVIGALRVKEYLEKISQFSSYNLSTHIICQYYVMHMPDLILTVGSTLE